MFTAPRRLCMAPQAPTPASAHTTENTSREMKKALAFQACNVAQASLL